MTRGGDGTMKLSILDQSPVSEGSTPREALLQTTELAKEVERLGYKRFWVSEHHFTKKLAGSSPEVLIAHLASHTSHIRVGSGGVMLSHYSPYKVAENFRLLETLYPGRIDAGMGRAPGGMPISTYALQEGRLSNYQDYPRKLDELIAYLHDALPETHRYKGLKATPIPEHPPELWLLGSSGESARLAAERGAAFAFAQFINGEGGEEVVQQYKRSFVPSIVGEKPNVLVSIFVICADTTEEAEKIAASLDLSILMLENGMPSNGIPSIETAQAYNYSYFEALRVKENRKRMIVGNPQQVKEQMMALSKAYETDEFMVVTITHDFAHKLRSYQLLAEVFQL